MNDERTTIDPDDRYPEDVLRIVEHNAALTVLALLPHGRVTRTRDRIQIDEGHAAEISALVTADALEFRLPTVQWTRGTYGPAPAACLWKRMRTAELSDERLGNLLCQAREAGLREYVNCRHCRRAVQREHRHGNVCHACAEQHLGIVH